MRGGRDPPLAPDPSTLRDVGTLLLVLWLPAVGNLIAYLIRKIPMRRPRPTAFRSGADFSAHLQTRIDSVSAPADWPAFDPLEQRCTVLVGQSAFTVRSAEPLAQWLPHAPQRLDLECLVPSAALPALIPGTPFHVLIGTTSVAQGRVVEQVGSP